MCLFFLLDFVGYFLFPLVYLSVFFIDCGFLHFFYFIDFFNVGLNTLFLFVSGLCLNVFVVMFLLHNLLLLFFMLFFSVCFGFLFVGMQFYEFNILFVTISVCCFVSGFLLLDFLHFFHVFFGCLLLFFLFLRVLCVFFSYLYGFICLIVFYWHFVDFVWFFLLRFVYLIF